MTKSANFVVVHLVFGTKNRKPYILPNVDDQLHRLFGSVCNKLDCQIIQSGGYYDRIHILCALSKNMPIKKLVEVLKSKSSRWIKTKAPYLKDFEWQTGYSIFAVSRQHVPMIQNYIRKQKSHHKKKTFSTSNQIFIKSNWSIAVKPWNDEDDIFIEKIKYPTSYPD